MNNLVQETARDKRSSSWTCGTRTIQAGLENHARTSIFTEWRPWQGRLSSATWACAFLLQFFFSSVLFPSKELLLRLRALFIQKHRLISLLGQTRLSASMLWTAMALILALCNRNVLSDARWATLECAESLCSVAGLVEGSRTFNDKWFNS